MDFKFTGYFLKQWKGLDEKSKITIRNKLELIKENPFRYPKHVGYRFVFKVKISTDNNYSRFMYAVFMPDNKTITILGIFNRCAGYKDFKKIFKNLKKQ